MSGKVRFLSPVNMLVAALLLCSRPEVFACAACFGQSDSRMAQGMNMGIFALLGVITCVLGGVAAFFIHLARRGSEPSQSFPRDLETISENSTNV